MSTQNFQVNYDINVTANGVDQLKTFGDAVKNITQAKLPLDTAVTNIQNMLNSIDKVFRDRNKKKRNFNYALKIDTKGTEDRLNKIVGLLDQIATKSKNIKLHIAAGKPLTAKQVKANAKNIADQNRELVRLTGANSLQTAAQLTKRIGRVNSALAHLERGREITIKTDVAKSRLQELVGLLGQVRKGTAAGLQFATGTRGPVNSSRTPFVPATPGIYTLPEKAQERLLTNQALQQQKLVHTNQNTAAKIRQQSQIEAARAQRKNVLQDNQAQEREAQRQAAAQAKIVAEQARTQRQIHAQTLRGYLQAGSQQEGLYNRTRQGAINRLQYSRPPSLRTMLPFGYMLNGYMMFNTMKREVVKAAEYANTMESARSILRVADTDLGTFESRFANMAFKVRQVGVETKFTATEVAGAVKYLAMAGQNIDTINKSIRPITNLALIGDNDLDTIADLTTNIMAGYDINPNSMPTVADIIASTISRSNVNILETAESFKMAAGTLRMAGIDFTEASAAIGLLGNMGLKGTLSGTSLRAITTRLANPTKGTRETLSRLGVNFKQKENVYGKEVESFRPLADIFEDMNKAGATLEDMYKIFGVRGANAAMMLLQNYEKLRELTSENRTSQGIADELAKVKQETTKGLWFQMTSRLSESFMSGYEIMEPQIKSVLQGFIDKFNTEEFSRGLASLGSALLDLMRVLANIATWFAKNFTWLGPTIFTGFVATKIFKLAGSITNLGVALGFLGKKSAALSAIQLLSSLTGMGGMGMGMGLRSMNFADKRNIVSAMNDMGIKGRGAKMHALRALGLGGGVRSLASGGYAGVFSRQVVTGRGIVGAIGSLGALGTGAVVAAGAFGILAAAVGTVVYRTWKMQEVHNAVISELEKKEKYSFPSIDALNESLRKAYTAAKEAKHAVDELTGNNKLIDETGQPMGLFSRRGLYSALIGHGRPKDTKVDNPYSMDDAYQDNITEALQTLARQRSVDIRSSFYGELGKQQDKNQASVFLDMIPHNYLLDINTVDSSLYKSGKYRMGPNKGEEWIAYNAETGYGKFRDGLKKDMTVADGMKTGVYINHINKFLVPELESRAQEYLNIISDQSYAEKMLSDMGLDFAELHDMGLRKGADGKWNMMALPANATDEEKQTHLKNSRLIHSDLVLVASMLREQWGNSGQIAENFMLAAGFGLNLFKNEPDRNDLEPWMKSGISTDMDDNGAGGNYGGSGKLSSAAPKQVIVNITSLLSVDTIALMKSENGRQPEIQELKEQMAQALIDVVHDFDASWHG